MQATRVAAEIREVTGEIVTLTRGGLWTFDVVRDGEVIWCMVQPGIFPVPGELRNLLTLQ
jgi:predicted Rdx family selenoprotein